MSKRDDLVFLYKHENRLTWSGNSKNALILIPSSLCIQTSYEIDEETPLLKAYQDGFLSQNQNYLSFYFPQRLQNKTECFFVPTPLLSSARFAMLDLSLPAQLSLYEICVLFIYSSYSLLCFYQNQTLQYCKKVQSFEDLNLCRHHIQTLFDYTSNIYCLSYLDHLPKEFFCANLIPLSSLFSPSAKDEGLWFESITLIQQNEILTLSIPPPKAYDLGKFMLFSLAFFVLITFIFCFFTHSPHPIQNKDTRSLQILSTLHSLPSNQPLFALLQELSIMLKDISILAINLSPENLLRIEFPDQIPQHLLNLLSSKGYVSKIDSPTTLEIAL